VYQISNKGFILRTDSHSGRNVQDQEDYIIIDKDGKATHRKPYSQEEEHELNKKYGDHCLWRYMLDCEYDVYDPDHSKIIKRRYSWQLKKLQLNFQEYGTCCNARKQKYSFHPNCKGNITDIYHGIQEFQDMYSNIDEFEFSNRFKRTPVDIELKTVKLDDVYYSCNFHNHGKQYSLSIWSIRNGGDLYVFSRENDSDECNNCNYRCLNYSDSDSSDEESSNEDHIAEQENMTEVEKEYKALLQKEKQRHKKNIKELKKKYTHKPKRKHTILSLLYAPKCDLQLGDSETTCYLLNNKHLLIWNDGDVYSVVVLRATR
jgi:hypothetical protein